MNNTPEPVAAKNHFTHTNSGAEGFTLRDELPAAGEPILATSFSPVTGKQQRARLQWRPVHFIAAGAVLVLISLAGLLFAAKSVIFVLEPAVAKINIAKAFALKLGEGYLMLPGDAQVTITAPGYHPLSSETTVTGEQNQRIHFSLEKLPGHLTVNAAINEPAEVWLDGILVGALNEKISNIEHGSYQLQVRAERYLPYTTSIDITGLDQHQTQTLELQPAWASVNIDSIPAGAELWVDGAAVGVTPLVAEILQGERDIALKLSGYKSWQDILDVKAGEQLSVASVALEKTDGLVLVKSSPSQASITVNGQYVGLTPQEVALAPGSTYQLTLFKDGYQPAQRKVAIVSGKDQSVDVQLVANLGQIRIRANPADALLYVDGRLMGRANQTLTLPASQTHIVLTKEGFADFQTTVLPRPNFEQVIAVQMKTLEQLKWEKTPPFITTSVGHSLKLFNPDSEFTMGSSRREQGRRANEAQRAVKLQRPFYLGLHEVSNAQFRAFAATHSSSHVKGNSLDGNNYPAVQITWQQAALYCNWLSDKEGLPSFYAVENNLVTGVNPQATGYRLPTEAEWEWAARFENGSMLKYPWGEQLPPEKNSGNYADRNAAQVAGFVQPSYDDGYVVSAPIGSFPANSKGIFDLGGNVAEWVNDFYDVATGLSLAATQDPLGPSSGDFHVIRGASWAHGNVTELRLSFRDYGKDARNDLGFRIARYVE